MDSFESLIYSLKKGKITESYCRFSIYFIECNGQYKIGSTSDLKSRFTTLQTSSPTLLRLVHMIPIPISHDHGQVEKALHIIFKDAHIRGEWYNLTQQDIERIKAVSIDVILQIAQKMKKIEESKGSDQLAFNFPDEK